MTALAVSFAAFATDWAIPSPTVDNKAALIALTNALAQAQKGDTVTLAKGVYDLSSVTSDVHATYLESHLYMPGRKILLRGDPAAAREEVVLKGGGKIRILRIKEDTNGYTKAPAFENLTFTNGYSAYWSGAVHLQGNDGDCGYYTNCVFTGCSSKQRCGTAWGGTFSKCLFLNNKAGSDYAGASARACAYDCVFIGNSANGNAGALNNSTCAIRCAFTNNTATGTGGALYDVRTVRDCTFYENEGGSSSSIGAGRGLTFVSNCVFEANKGCGGGCGAITLCSNAKVYDCKFYNNWCAGSGPGAIAPMAGTTGQCVYNCVFTNNESWSSMGVGSGCSLWSNCTFIANSKRIDSPDRGSNAGIKGGRAIDCVFRDQFCTTTAYRIDPRLPCVHETGSTIGRVSASCCELLRCDIKGSIDGGSATRCVIWGVTNTYGLVINDCALTNCLIRDNYMPSRHIFTNQRIHTTGIKGDPVLVNCTVVNNTGRMFYTTNSFALNTIFIDNIDANGSSKMDLNCNTQNGVLVTNCIYRYANSSVKPKNSIKLTAAETPKFNKGRDAEYPYYMPRNSSKAVGKGAAVDWPEGAVDLGGYPRVRDGAVDIGCYESWIPVPGMMFLIR